MSELEKEWAKVAPQINYTYWLEQEVLRQRALEAAARAVVESAGTFPSRPLYADIAALRAALEGK